MKSILLTLLLVCSLVSKNNSQSFTEKIVKTFQFEKKSPQNAVLVYNINGQVTVEGTTGDQIIVEVEKIIHAKTDTRLSLGKEEIQLGVMDRADSIIFYVKGTQAEFSFRNGSYNNWGYNGNNGRWNEVSYDYTMNFKIKVPASVHVLASTVNNGDILISNIGGKVKARNVNGDIQLEKVMNASDVHTINGDVDVTYTKNPTTDCNYYTLNGHLHVNFAAPVSGTMSFKSFNGELYTNIDPLENMAPSVTRVSTQKGTKFKIDNQFKIRSGGPHFDVETFNGNAIIKEIK